MATTTVMAGEDFQDSLRTEKRDEPKAIDLDALSIADVVADIAFLGGGDIDSNGLSYRLEADDEHLLVTVSNDAGETRPFRFEVL